MDIFAKINAGVYKNDLPYARPKKDRAAFDAYQAETARLSALFEADLIADLGLEPGPAADALLAFVWEKGHADGFSEAAGEARDAVDLLRAGATAERARLRKELLEAIGPPMDERTTSQTELRFRKGWNADRQRTLDALDRIAPEGK